MPEDREASHIRALAHDLLRRGVIGTAQVIESGLVGTPIAVQAPDGLLNSWFVPITIGDLLAGFIQFLPDGTFMRFSSFQRHAGSLAGCPAAADWLDPDRIQARAKGHRQSDERSGEPFLTFDKSPDRLVWAVPMTKPGGDVRYVYVAGKIVYVASPDDTTGQ